MRAQDGSTTVPSSARGGSVSADAGQYVRTQSDAMHRKEHSSGNEATCLRTPVCQAAEPRQWQPPSSRMLVEMGAQVRNAKGPVAVLVCVSEQGKASGTLCRTMLVITSTPAFAPGSRRAARRRRVVQLFEIVTQLRRFQFVWSSCFIAGRRAAWVRLGEVYVGRGVPLWPLACVGTCVCGGACPFSVVIAAQWGLPQQNPSHAST